jgi:hypothetical protein
MFSQLWRRFINWLGSCRLQQPPEYPHRDRHNTETEDYSKHYGQEPITGVWRAPAIEIAVRQMLEQQEEYHAREREVWERQLQAARCLNHITLGGAIIAILALLAVARSVLIAQKAAVDARDALHASQRPWVVAESVVRLDAGYYPTILCKIGYRVDIKNTGNSVATNLIFDSRAVHMPPTWIWLRDQVDKLKDATIKLWSSRRPEGLPVGIVLAPQQDTSPPRCPWFADGADPTNEQIKTGAFLVIGYAQYKDQFLLPHHTRFAFAPTGDSAHAWDGQTFMIYNDYQDAD